jgi:hypothetical protein
MVQEGSSFSQDTVHAQDIQLPGSRQSRFKSRNRQSSSQQTPMWASLQHVIYPNLEIEVANPDGNTTNTTEYISVSEALKLPASFKDEKRDVIAFIANEDRAFKVIALGNDGTLFKSVLTRISGEPKTAIAHGNLENWEELKQFLKNTYTEKQILEYHASLLFSTRKTNAENVS